MGDESVSASSLGHSYITCTRLGDWMCWKRNILRKTYLWQRPYQTCWKAEKSWKEWPEMYLPWSVCHARLHLFNTCSELYNVRGPSGNSKYPSYSAADHNASKQEYFHNQLLWSALSWEELFLTLIIPGSEATSNHWDPQNFLPRSWLLAKIPW